MHSTCLIGVIDWPRIICLVFGPTRLPSMARQLHDRRSFGYGKHCHELHSRNMIEGGGSGSEVAYHTYQLH